MVMKHSERGNHDNQRDQDHSEQAAGIGYHDGENYLMSLFILKIVISASLIATCSWLAGQRPGLAGFLTALPLASILAITWAYLEHRDMGRINDYAVSILVAVPLSLTFFIPFVLNRWIKMSFWVSLTMGVLFLLVSYLIHSALIRGR